MTVRFLFFDLRNFVTTRPLRTILPLVLVVVFGVSLPVPGAPIVVGGIIAVVTGSYYFQDDERGLLDTLYATSPIGRGAVVLGRYLSLLIMAAAAIGVGLLTTLITVTLRHQVLGWSQAGMLLLIAFAIVSVVYAVQLPWLFALGFTRGRPMIYIPVGVIAVAGFAAAQTGMLDGTLSPGIPALPAPWISIVAFALGSVLIVASAMLARRLYAHRDF